MSHCSLLHFPNLGFPLPWAQSVGKADFVPEVLCLKAYSQLDLGLEIRTRSGFQLINS